MKVTKVFNFSYGHVLPNHKGKCRNPHGHNARLEVTVAGDVNNDTGMIIDFGDLKRVVKGVVDNYDHAWIFAAGDDKDLYKLFQTKNWKYKYLGGMKVATAEGLAYVLLSEICNALDDSAYEGLVVSLRLYETPDSWVEV